jgi:hypothetical protein
MFTLHLAQNAFLPLKEQFPEPLDDGVRYKLLSRRLKFHSVGEAEKIDEYYTRSQTVDIFRN